MQPVWIEGGRGRREEGLGARVDRRRGYRRGCRRGVGEGVGDGRQGRAIRIGYCIVFTIFVSIGFTQYLLWALLFSQYNTTQFFLFF